MDFKVLDVVKSVCLFQWLRLLLAFAKNNSTMDLFFLFCIAIATSVDNLEPKIQLFS